MKKIKAYGKNKVGYIESKEVKDFFRSSKENIWDLSPVNKTGKSVFETIACDHEDGNNFYQIHDNTGLSSSVLLSHANQNRNDIDEKNKNVSSPSCEQYLLNISEEQKHTPQVIFKKHAKKTSNKYRKKFLKIKTDAEIYKGNLQCPDLTWSDIDNYSLAVEKENFNIINKEICLIKNDELCQSSFSAYNYDFLSSDEELLKTSGNLLHQDILVENSIDNNTSNDSLRSSKVVSSFEKQNKLGFKKIVTSTPISQYVMVDRTNGIENQAVSSIYRTSSDRHASVTSAVFENRKDVFSFHGASRNKITVPKFFDRMGRMIDSPALPSKNKYNGFNKDQFVKSSLQCYNNGKNSNGMELLNENSNELFQSSTSIEYVNTSSEEAKQHSTQDESCGVKNDRRKMSKVQIKQLSRTPLNCKSPEDSSGKVKGKNETSYFHISDLNKIKYPGFSFHVPLKQSYLVTKSYSQPASYKQMFLTHDCRKHRMIGFHKTRPSSDAIANLCFSKSKSLECIFTSDLRFQFGACVTREQVCEYSNSSSSVSGYHLSESIKNSKKCHLKPKFKAIAADNCSSNTSKESIKHNSKLEQNENSLNSITYEQFTKSISYVQEVGSVTALLHLCRQDEVINFCTVYAWNFGTLKKIGEGSYGEVFLLKQRRKTSVLKIVPLLIDNEIHTSKTYQHIVAEIKVAQCMSSLKGNETNCTENFCTLNRLCIVKGLYPSKLIEAWDKYNTIHHTNNLHPNVYEYDQMYVIFETEYGGEDLDKHGLKSAVESESIFNQVVLSLAVAEEMHHFEHRDLHFGNILVQKTNMKVIKYSWRGKKVYLPSCGLLVKIIDFTLSCLISPSGKIYYRDLANDVSLFEQTGDYQFDIYRLMKDNLDNEWKRSNLYSNVLWLNYLCDKFLNYQYKHFRRKQHKNSLQKFVENKNILMNCNSTIEFLAKSNIL